MKKAAFITLGCKVNFYDSEAMAELFKKSGYEIVSGNEKADVYVINTCTVTNVGDKKSRQAIRRVKRLNPEALVIAAGCYSQTSPQKVGAIEGVNIVLGTADRSRIVEIAENYRGDGVFYAVGNIMKIRDFEGLTVDSLEGRTRAYIKIQEGCDRFCSYCIIPFARGPVRSRPLDDIISEVERLSERGFKEVVLTGIHIASYGRDFKDVGLVDVLKAVSKVEGIERIRFSSVEPTVITDEFLEELEGLPKVCRHFHLSLQSGCDKTLKAMNRRYTSEEYYEAVKKLRGLWSDCAVTTDIIAGFPGETDEDFRESLDFAEKCKIAKIHAFPYSPKEGTVAAKMKGQISTKVKQQRVEMLLELSRKNGEEFLNGLLGKDYEVLFEEETEDGVYRGHTSNYVGVYVKSDEDIINRALKVRLEKVVDEGNMRGRLVEG
ncbi:MAG: tRNA (N(6)-L-threonylcarbamoyladenosine(37)-C(2))-methylthiotransferase MtaB [Clostridiales bacterium]|nr:tRNA (N(6)-L-threonylcarbamoyladenosine(37)-C(2))-methylthiotransferase MtaB [Clostridiales bacterium]